MKKVVGIDIAYKTIAASFISNGGQVNKEYANNLTGFKELLGETGTGFRFVMEATGPYFYALAHYLHGRGCAVSVENPLVIRNYCRMDLRRAKTDKADAIALRTYGEERFEKLGLWQPSSENDMIIRHLYGILEKLTVQRTSLSNQLHAYGATGHLSGEVAETLERLLQEAKNNIKALEAQLERHIKDGYPDLYENLLTIPAIGKKSALLLAVSCKGFQNFTGYKQVIAYLGTAPRPFESGTSVKGKRHICKMGMKRVRTVLFMAAKSAIRCNRSCKALYERLREKGKPYRVALVAVMNKLIKQAFAIAKSGMPYQENFVNNWADAK